MTVVDRDFRTALLPIGAKYAPCISLKDQVDPLIANERIVTT